MSIQLAGCVILNSKREVLLIHRNTFRLTQWELPGGKVELGETLAQTAARETKEEIGVEVRIMKRLGVMEFDDSGTHWVYTWFQATVTSGIPHVIELDKHDMVEYFDLLAPATKAASLSINIDLLVAAIRKGEVKLVSAHDT